jgi:dienelactone hydrolase
VVVSADHFDSYNVAWPNGLYQSSSLNKSQSLAGLADRVRDLAFITDELTRWNQSDPFFQGKLDPSRLGVIGVSWGGATVGEFGRADARCRAVITLDPGGEAPEISSYALPSLTIGSVDWTSFKVFEASRTNAVFFRLRDSDHGSLGSFYIYSRYPLNANREASRTINAYELSFFNKHLLGQDDGLLNGPPDTNRFPRVMDFRIK